MLKRLNEGSRLQGSLDLPRFPNSTLLPFFLVPLLKPNSRKKGTPYYKGATGEPRLYPNVETVKRRFSVAGVAYPNVETVKTKVLGCRGR